MNVERSSVERSVQPVLMVSATVRDAGEGGSAYTATYVGGGALECDMSDDARKRIMDSNALFFGHHGPKHKETQTYETGYELQYLAFADEKTADCFLPNTVAMPEMRLGGGRVTVPMSYVLP